MDTKYYLQNALNLSPAEKLYIIEVLSQSLSEPDKNIDHLWKGEVESRYEDYQNGKIKSISYDDILKN
jgi:putative addiction module component (TIGR02574 family)